jgi:hypothetical protein
MKTQQLMAHPIGMNVATKLIRAARQCGTRPVIEAIHSKLSITAGPVRAARKTHPSRLRFKFHRGHNENAYE